MSKIGILSAMKEEFDLLLNEVEVEKKTTLAKREFIEGKLWGKDVVLVFSQWGKTASAATTANLINVFKIDKLIFTGVAGSLNDEAKIGDIIIADTLFHHDVDASPFKPKYYVPLVGENGIKSSFELNEKLKSSCNSFIKDIKNFISEQDMQAFSLNDIRVHFKNIATGDFFVKTDKIKNEITKNLPEMYAVEMEGAAVAQVCWEHDIDFAVIRTISDSANSDSHIDYPRFLNKVANIYSREIIRNFLKLN